ncbi:glycosyltransferase [Zoogloea sp.]|uniref:glycosyltransferase n=1 Tax=Zoogloea sp. TaxID=49181 RepID=UPI0035AD8D5A
MTPKKILLMAHDVTLAHLGRPLRLAEGLIADGHAVTLAASAESARFLKDFPGEVRTLAPTGKARFIDNLAKGRPVFDFETLRRFCEEDEALLATLRPDLVIGDFRITLSVSARRAGVPYATITNAYWSPAFTPRFVVPNLPMVPILGVGVSQAIFDLVRPLAFAVHARPMNRLRRHYGLPSLGSDLRRIYTDADLALFSDIPEIYGLPPDSEQGGVFLGPIDWSPDIPLPGWWSELDAQRPTIYVTLGSSGASELLPPLLEGLGRLDAQLIVSTAGAPLPALSDSRVFCAEYLPGAAAAAITDMVVCNGGSPTSYQALAKGVPVLGLPGNLDQFLNMYYLEKNRLGLSLRGTPPTAKQVAAKAARVLHETAFRQSALGFAKVIEGYDNASRLRDALRRFGIISHAPGTAGTG